MDKAGRHFGWIAAIGLALAFAAVTSTRASDPDEGIRPVANFQSDVLPFLKAHCFHCHGNGKSEADLVLDKYTDDESLIKDRKVWDNVLHMIGSGEMPPKERPRPMAGEIETVLKSIEAIRASFDCTQSRNVGRVTLRRLNRVEYNNTIRDLVGVDFQPAADFPADDVGYGFDNIGDVLSTTPLLFEKYLQAAETILQKAIVTPEPVEPKDLRLEELRVTREAGETTDGGAALYGAGEVRGETYLDAGDYIIRVQAYAKHLGDEKVKAAIRVGGQTLKEFEVTSEDRDELLTLEARTRVKSGTARIAVGFLNPFVHPDSTDESPQRRLLLVRGIVVDGPYDPPPPPAPEIHQRLMAHAPNLAAARGGPRNRGPVCQPCVPPPGDGRRGRADPGGLRPGRKGRRTV